jgi:hypothetical protein
MVSADERALFGLDWGLSEMGKNSRSNLGLPPLVGGRKTSQAILDEQLQDALARGFFDF